MAPPLNKKETYKSIELTLVGFGNDEGEDREKKTIDPGQLCNLIIEIHYNLVLVHNLLKFSLSIRLCVCMYIVGTSYSKKSD